jgi:hypothetical protein
MFLSILFSSIYTKIFLKFSLFNIAKYEFSRATTVAALGFLDINDNSPKLSPVFNILTGIKLIINNIFIKNILLYSIIIYTLPIIKFLITRLSRIYSSYS